MEPTVENAKLLATLLAILQKENSKQKDSLLEQVYAAMNEKFDDSSGIKFLQVEGIEDPIPIQVFRGERGDQGFQGIQGEVGPRGLLGETGPQGPQGPMGRLGPQGHTGAKGETGEKGEKGEKGEDGKDFDSRELEKKFLKLYDDFVRNISSQITRMAIARGGDLGAGSSGGGEVWLHFLNDVDTNSVKYAEDNQAFAYNANTGQWEARFLSGFGLLDPRREGDVALANSQGVTSATFNNANDTITFTRPNADTFDVVITGFSDGAASNVYVNDTFETKASANSRLANTNTFIATKLDTTTFNAALANTNSYIATKLDTSTHNAALANTNSFIATKLDTTTFNAALANTNTYIATKLDAATHNAALANTNSYIGSVGVSTASWADANDTITFTRPNASTFDVKITGFGTGTASNSYVNDTFETKATANTRLANTNAFIATKLDTTAFNLALANTNSYISSQLANTNAYIATKLDTSTFNAALANTNAYIATMATTASVNDTFETKANANTRLANTNAFIATKLNTSTFNAALANTNAYIATKLNTSTFNAALANTNNFIENRLPRSEHRLVNLLDVDNDVADGYILKYASANSTFFFAAESGGGAGSVAGQFDYGFIVNAVGVQHDYGGIT
jgi:hypothetical protein